jgi:hypothetical protein
MAKTSTNSSLRDLRSWHLFLLVVPVVVLLPAALRLPVELLRLKRPRKRPRRKRKRNLMKIWALVFSTKSVMYRHSYLCTKMEGHWRSYGGLLIGGQSKTTSKKYSLKDLNICMTSHVICS